jgi:hypothetical protein
MTETGGNTALASTLGTLAAVSLVVGLYAFIWPRSFYDHMLGVDRLPPYSDLLADVGGFYLGFAVLFAWAAVDRSRALVLATCAAWVEVQSLHLAYHVTHLEHFNVSTAVAQTVLLSAAPAVAVAAGLLGARASGTARAGATSAIRRCRVPRRLLKKWVLPRGVAGAARRWSWAVRRTGWGGGGAVRRWSWPGGGRPG